MSTAAPAAPPTDWARLQVPALAAGGAGLALCALAAVLGLAEPRQLLTSWLVAFLFWLGLALGSLALLMLQNLTGGRWGIVLRNISDHRCKTGGYGGLSYVADNRGFQVGAAATRDRSTPVTTIFLRPDQKAKSDVSETVAAAASNVSLFRYLGGNSARLLKL